MGIKCSWSRVKDHEAYRANMEAVEAYEKKRRARMAKALAVTGGKVKRSKGD